MKFNHTWEEVENAGRLYNVEFSIDYNVTPCRPARINCDPDDSYPAEGGEVVINKIKVLSVEVVDVGMRLNSRGQRISWLATEHGTKLSDLQQLYWSERFEKQINDDFMIELAEYAAADDEAARESGC